MVSLHRITSCLTGKRRWDMAQIVLVTQHVIEGEKEKRKRKK